MTTLRWFASRYDRRSAVALVILLCCYATVGTIWRRHMDFYGVLDDHLLLGIWAYMTALLCWAIEPRRDLIRAGVGLAGGLFIEGWGTVSEIWHYFTAERPPLWIIPAWPVAAIAIDRMSKGAEVLIEAGRIGPRAQRVLWWLALPPFVVAMTWFVWPTIDVWLTRLAVIGMVGVCVWPGRVRQDLALFFAGAALGVFLEYWGTSRRCWTYYTLEIPPVQAVFAHGFASIGFQRAADVAETMLVRLVSVAQKR